MNFKTTLILAVVLLGLGAYIFYTKDKGGGGGEKTEVTDTSERKLFTVKPEDITKITVMPADGKRMVLEKPADGKWRLTEPVAAQAEAFEVDNLARTLAELKAHGRMTESSDNATGLASPQYKVEFVTSDNKTQRLAVGKKSAVGDNLYVAVDDSKTPDVVGTEVLERLDKPASGYRNPKVMNMPTSDVRQVTIAHTDGGTIKLQKSGDQWRVTEPKEMPADSAEVDDVIFAVTGLRASDWVAEDQKDAKQYQLDHPRVTVTMSASTRPVGVGAATQAATNPSSQPAVATLKIGRYDDVLRKNVMVASSDNPAIAKAPASIIETLNKKPIEFRDKKAVQIVPDHVAKIEILSDVPATTRPTSRPAVKKEVVIKRHVPTLPVGIAAPTSQMAAATSKPAAATQASSQPAATTKPTLATSEPAGKWELLGEKTEPAADAKVDDLLLAINPLRAEKYLDAKPATSQPTPTYTLKITTQAPGGAAPEQHVLTVVDVDETKPPVATYEDLSFEVSRAVVDKLKQDFSKSAAPAGNIANTPTPGFPEAAP